ncbi:MAG: thioredoxin domain-containing protein [Candidatus Caccosoma sp.]|nr:thioredoxin domain-containing protein [Candidatus Caccosoma sp.]
MKKKIIIIPLLFCMANAVVSCNNENYTSFKEYVDIVNNQDATKQDIFVFKSSTCSNCKKIQPYLDRYIKENNNENLNIHTINLDVNSNNSFADNTLG